MNAKISENRAENIPTKPDSLLKLLDELGISYELHHHEAAFTVRESAHLKDHIAGVHCRNLFLRDKKKAMFLVVAANETEIDLKKLENLLGSARLSFGSAERLWEHLGIYPGAVCPFTVINDPDHHVKVVLDASIMPHGLMNVHPLDNTKTVSVSPQDLLKFFVHTGHEPLILDLSAAAPEA